MSSHLVHVLSYPAEGRLDGLPDCLPDSPELLSAPRTCLIPPAIPGPFAGCTHLHISLLTVNGFDRGGTAWCFIQQMMEKLYFWHLLIYLCHALMGPAVVQSEHVAHNRPCPGSWREAGLTTVLNVICSDEENCNEEQQTFDIPVHKGSNCRKDWIHFINRASSLSDSRLRFCFFSCETESFCGVLCFQEPAPSLCVRERLGVISCGKAADIWCWTPTPYSKHCK